METVQSGGIRVTRLVCSRLGSRTFVRFPFSDSSSTVTIATNSIELCREMSLSKPTVALATLAAAACPAAAFHASPNVMHPAANEGMQTRTQTIVSSEMSSASSSSSTVSSGVAVSGVATLAAAAVLMANSRHVAKPHAKTVVMAFESER
eukprot:5813496-Amphidinium_carterae.1